MSYSVCFFPPNCPTKIQRKAESPTVPFLGGQQGGGGKGETEKCLLAPHLQAISAQLHSLTRVSCRISNLHTCPSALWWGRRSGWGKTSNSHWHIVGARSHIPRLFPRPCVGAGKRGMTGLGSALKVLTRRQGYTC